MRLPTFCTSFAWIASFHSRPLNTRGKTPCVGFSDCSSVPMESSRSALCGLKSIPSIMIFSGILSLYCIWLISRSKRSSCERNAWRTCQTTLYRLLSLSASDGLIPPGTATGRIMYPYFLPLALRMTRPTAWITSTTELRGFRNNTASRFGTSTPSVRHLAFERIRHTGWPSCVVLSSPESHPSSFSRSAALKPPSIWRASTRKSSVVSSLFKSTRWVRTSSSNWSAIFLESLIERLNATARRIGWGSWAKETDNAPAWRFARPFQHPTSFATSSNLSSWFSSARNDWKCWATWSSATLRTKTL